MSAYFYVAAVAFATFASLLFATLNYSLRDMSRLRLEQYLQRHRQTRWLEPTLEHRSDLLIVTAVGRLIANTFIALTLFDGLHRSMVSAACLLVGGSRLPGPDILLLVALPHALAEIAGVALVGTAAAPLHLLRKTLAPFSRITSLIETRVQSTVGSDTPEPAKIEEELLSVVGGEKEGVVDQQERVIIESAITFHDTTTGRIMTPAPTLRGFRSIHRWSKFRLPSKRPAIRPSPSTKARSIKSLASCTPGTCCIFWGRPPCPFDIKSITRPAFFVPESKTLRNLLHDFRLQKVHIAVVLDEYGGTAGLVTIEDMLEQLLGDISDEHEPQEPPMFDRIDDQVSEVDARLPIDELNRLTGLSLPEDAGYETLGGFISTTLGRIPKAGTVLEHSGANFTVLDAEPQRVKRLRVSSCRCRRR